mmetsp:Transcript_45564/g.148076  ORF Transcript_45564/g.148076 Transcript_45564/m.148076 type:complete len:118 (+) Transcript_45564:304-657(+)
MGSRGRSRTGDTGRRNRTSTHADRNRRVQPARYGQAFAPSGRVVTLAYYPDGKQERMLGLMSEHVDAMHAMAYDQSGRHSTYAFAEKVAAQAVELLPPSKVTLGLPFYGRHLQTGER